MVTADTARQLADQIDSLLGVLNADQADESEESEMYAEMVEEYLEQLIKRDFIGKLRIIIADLLPLVVERTIKE